MQNTIKRMRSDKNVHKTRRTFNGHIFKVTRARFRSRGETAKLLTPNWWSSDIQIITADVFLHETNDGMREKNVLTKYELQNLIIRGFSVIFHFFSDCT